MKIGILTHYQVESHGACLQMYALKKVLEGLGHDVVILTYSKNYDFSSDYDSNKYSVSIRNAPWYIKEYLIKQGPGILFYSYRKHVKLAAFIKRNFTYSSYSAAKVDVAIVGADEVFSLQHGPNIAMYGHGVSADRMVAYAPSFGQTDIPRIRDFHCEHLISSGLNSFARLSVRDRGSWEVVRDLTGLDVPIVCDPALLYSFKEEKREFEASGRDDYIAVYSYNTCMNEDWQINQVREFAKENGLKVYSVGSYHKWCDKQISCDPLELLQYFSRAAYVVTDTFHGTICSTITQTPVAVYVRDTNNVKLDFLLDQLGLANRKAGKQKDIREVFMDPEDFSDIERRIAVLREQGMCYIKEALGHDR